MTDKIFISIAAYRDPETVPSIIDAIEKAQNPQNLYFGLVLQDDDDIDISDIEKNKNIQILRYNWRESQGTCWARSTIQESLYNNEKYFLQLDSHHRFCVNWDNILIESLEKLKTDHKKPIIGGYCPSYNPKDDQNLTGNACKINAYSDFTSQGDLVFYPKAIKNIDKLIEKDVENIPARFLSGHFIFSDGIFCQECPYDPNLYFRGEEISLSARAYTCGYDFFHPTKCIIWHEYIRASEQKHWDNHTKENGFLVTANERSDNAKARVRALLNMESSNIKFNKYGLGKERPLHEYELYAGLDFKTKRVHKYAYDIKDIYKPPFIMSELEWENGLMKKYKLEFTISDDLLKELKNPKTEVVCFIPEVKAGLPVYRKDIKPPHIGSLPNKMYIESSMDEKPTQIAIVQHIDKKFNKTILHDFRILP